ncbi:hypothetical protein [Mobilicoccus caccae]|uniref:hypothetical protein n=1 Tax=Mobilicoccus caccae TaxID=1859295 RepID=UPI0024E19607|nr:hypothetical protein [Mobilicoccus caccae]
MPLNEPHGGGVISTLRRLYDLVDVLLALVVGLQLHPVGAVPFACLKRPELRLAPGRDAEDAPLRVTRATRKLLLVSAAGDGAAVEFERHVKLRLPGGAQV